MQTILAASEVRLPMHFVKKRPYVAGWIGKSGPFWFLIDTGSSTSILRRWVVEQEGLPSRPWKSESYGFAGVGKTDAVCRVKSLRLGGAKFLHFDADVQPGNPKEQINGKRVAGILGFPMFQDCLFTLDYRAREIGFAKGALPPANGRDVLPFVSLKNGSSKLGRLPLVSIAANGRSFTALLDSGLINALTLPEPLAKHLAPDQPIERIPRLQLYGADGDGQNMRFVRVPLTFRVGQYPIFHPPAFVAKAVGALRMGFLILGGEFLQHFSLTFDQKQRLVRLSAPDFSEGKPYRLDYRTVELRMKRIRFQFKGPYWKVPHEISAQGKILRKGDVILLVNSEPVADISISEWNRMVKTKNEVTLSLLREGELIDVRFPLAFLPKTR